MARIRRHVAMLTIHGADGMTSKKRMRIAAWLRAQGDALQNEGRAYAKRFTARYMK